MRLTKGTENLGLPDYIKFGLELEVENVNYNKVKRELKEKGWHADKDLSLTDAGVESVSPVLFEDEEHSPWQDVDDVCSIIEDSPNDTSRQAYTDHTCGGHIHFDASIFLENPEITKNLLRLWADAEEISYKMCNGINDPIRPSAINQSHITLIDVCKTLLKSPLPENTNLYKSKSLKDKIKLCREIARNVRNNAVKAYRKTEK